MVGNQILKGEADMEYSIMRLARIGVIFGIVLLAYFIFLIKKRQFIFALFFKKEIIAEKYKEKNDVIFLRGGQIFLLIAAIVLMLYLSKIILDIPYILNEEYFYLEGYTVGDSHGGASLPYEKRSIYIKDEKTGEVSEVIVFSEYIDENEYIKVEFLPNTMYGAIISRGEQNVEDER